MTNTLRNSAFPRATLAVSSALLCAAAACMDVMAVDAPNSPERPVGKPGATPGVRSIGSPGVSGNVLLSRPQPAGSEGNPTFNSMSGPAKMSAAVRTSVEAASSAARAASSAARAASSAAQSASTAARAAATAASSAAKAASAAKGSGG